MYRPSINQRSILSFKISPIHSNQLIWMIIPMIMNSIIRIMHTKIPPMNQQPQPRPPLPQQQQQQQLIQARPLRLMMRSRLMIRIQSIMIMVIMIYIVMMKKEEKRRVRPLKNLLSFSRQNECWQAQQQHDLIGKIEYLIITVDHPSSGMSIKMIEI